MIHLAFLWHMHQPYYVDPASGVAVLPWVRLHATRAYYDMASLAQEYPEVHQTFNLVPVLLEQLEQQAHGGLDAYRILTQRPAADLTELEARFLVDQFFQINWHTLIHPNPGYRRLLDLRGGEHVPPDVLRRFTVQDLRDLQVWFNLAWCGFTAFRDFPALGELRARQRGFQEEDKRVLLDVQDQIVARIIPSYRSLVEQGISELTTSPYFHPILPLLCDSAVASRSQPHLPLPDPLFQYPQDALGQVQAAVAYHTRLFGQAPRGIWPSEGSISPEIVPLLQKAGLSWFASSEGNLHRSSFEPAFRPPIRDAEGRPSPLTPYQAGGISVFFRHLELSDLIGFTYSKWSPSEAAGDLLGRIHRVAAAFPSGHGRPPCVPIILDGENPWEHYPDGGESFLRQMYEGIIRDPRIRGATYSEHLDRHPAEVKIKDLWSGSWIGSNFSIWIGHREDRQGWKRLEEARRFFEDTLRQSPPPPEANIVAARRSLYAAEGSDWFWWFGDEFSSQSDFEFDRLFRAHLSGVYQALGVDPPENLSLPIKGLAQGLLLDPPAIPVYLAIDGRSASGFSWSDTREIPLKAAAGAMAHGASFLKSMRYGYNNASVFLRIEPGVPMADLGGRQMEIDLLLVSPCARVARIPLLPTTRRSLPTSELQDANGGTSATACPDPWIACAIQEVVDLEIPRGHVDLHAGGTFRFCIVVREKGRETFRYPPREVYLLEVPPAHMLERHFGVGGPG